MKVICDRAALLDAVNVVAGVVASRTPSHILQCMKITAFGGTMVIAATDTEVGLRVGVDQVDIEEEGEVLVPADKLVQIIRSSSDPTVTLQNDDHTLQIIAGHSQFKVFGYDPREAPEIRDFSDATVDCEVPAGVLQRLIGRTLFAAASEHSRYAINGVLFDRDGKKIRMVATDGRRLAVAIGECTTAEDKSSCIIPAKALNVLNKLVDEPDAPVRIAIEESEIILAVGDGPDAAVLSSSLVEGAFPPFEDVIPKDQDKRVRFDAQQLSVAIKQAALLTNEESKGVRLSFTSERLTLSSRAPELGEAMVEIDLEKYEGDPLDIGFNPGYIVDALKVVDSDEVMVELKAPNKPGVIRTGADFTYVLMPVNLS